uniref:Enhancer of split region protein HLHm1 n=1 Tax=Teleopsis dalmanni TaxID=139649 RepID=G9I1L5_TELDL|nr:enhancer of split region protein HLHm1 [Teleopsis dalmanni]
MCKSLTISLFLAAFLICNISANSVPSDADDCPLICPALYSPVCGYNGKLYKEFSNSCELKSSNCRLERSAVQPYAQTDIAWCTSDLVENLLEKLGNLDINKPECFKPCPMIYQPVCVSNGKLRATVAHPCAMDLYNCAMGSDCKY